MSNQAWVQNQSATGHRTFDLGGMTPMENFGAMLEHRFDPFGVTTAMLNAHMAWLLHPQELARALSALSGDVMALQAHLARRALGMPSEDVVVPHADDSRFADPAWKDAPTWDIIKEFYLALTHRLQDMYFETPGLSEKERRRAAFWAREWLNAVAPTNFFLTNPLAMRRFVETRGESLRNGVAHLMRDLRSGTIRMVEEDAFTVGKDLATTPGQVVFRNRLLEVIHYAPTTETVHRTPIVIVTPWINKFYILDLTAKKSLVKFLVDQGFSVFITSWKNPTAEMRDVGFDDYLTEGVAQAVEVARKCCGAAQVHLVGYCIGGTLVSTYMAWANRHYGTPSKVPVAHWTLFTTLTDFSRPGDIDVFIDEDSIRWLEEQMERKGYLDGSEMASSFRTLRSNGLIWHYYVHSYLYGEELPPFDVLYWNMDSTRMPAAMHSFYLREMYLHNNLIRKDALHLAGEPIDLERITQPLYAVTAEDDHIVPWRQGYRVRKIIRSPVRFVLSTSGHILGIVNPPVSPPKRSYWVADPARGEHVDRWFARAEKHDGSWWTDWVDWLRPQCGELVTPPTTAGRGHPDLGAAPGEYVREK